MKIRSITYFTNSMKALEQKEIQNARIFNLEARKTFSENGFVIQTLRLATTPFSKETSLINKQHLVDYARAIEDQTRRQGFDYVAIGPAFPDELEYYDLIPEVLSQTDNVFLTGMMTTTDGKVSIPAVRACAHIIQKASTITQDGFTNLRFTALANVPPGAPFFPAAYSLSNKPSFALAMEAADLAVETFREASSLEEARNELIKKIENYAHQLTMISDRLTKMLGIDFGGIDFTLAPFPEQNLSFGAAMEQIGVPAVGKHGSLAAAAILADTLDRAKFRKAGFNGLMMPVLEDAVLAKRVADGNLTITDLLLYSSVCGTGLDTIPLPGDISEEQIAALLLDVASLAQRLDKPLTARLMPIPGKKAGDPTEFDFSYFANSHVLGINASPLRNFFKGDESFLLERRPHS
jgi:uncharacterized protein